ncbi:MAG: sugar ABC transporter permease [Firmicutes bacterium]|jgi:multiple sugar transport system permease protein|nr:sugar ABC transporter permease [Bacillota bacterium]
METRWGILMALPAILGFLMWSLLPMVASLVISFTEWSVVSKPKFIGFANFNRMFTQDPLFWKSLYVTAYYTFLSVPAVIVSAFLIATLLNQEVKGLAIFRTIFYLPSVVPAVANAVLWLWLFNPDFGLLNTVLGSLGIGKSLWIYDEASVLPSLVLMSVWGMGNTMIIFLAGLQGVPRQLYEAAEIDGANFLQRWAHITLPMVSSVIFFNLVMGLIGTFQVFSQAYVMTDGGPNNSSLFMVYYLFRNAFQYGRMGYASAIAWMIFLIVLAFTLVIFKSSPAWVYYEGERR